ncbi:MAG: hypothetical protein IJ087_21770 [Eggerthellaceae bacterium]|nr:hypothetical protein [Eggerthellaceae bacterium]
MAKPPFHSFAFTLIEDKRPRKSLRMTVGEEGMYDLQVQVGSAANPSSQFTRRVPVEAAERLRDALQAVGAFGWDESYGDDTAPGSRRWMMSVVFEEGVFTMESKGGSDAPPGFDDLLEELYRLDFPRPASAAPPAAVKPSSIGDLAAFASEGGFPNLDSTELQRRIKDEVAHMSPDERAQLIDMLVDSGMGTREFWENYFGQL